MANTREPINKKLRFEIFKRDLFRCQYCGNTPPSVTLEVDHIHPVSKGGTNETANLLTACFDCNRGKGATALNSVPLTPIEKTEVMLERELQYSEYQKVLQKIERRIVKECNKIDELYSEYYPDYCLKDTFKQTSVRDFIKRLGYAQVRESMLIACSKSRLNDSQVIKYFCAVCWNKIREN